MSDAPRGDAESRHRELSSRFRATWAFQQFLSSLQKLFVEGSAAEHAVRFKDLYARIKAFSANPGIRGDSLFDEVNSTLGSLVDDLLVDEERVTPPLLRQFFQRFPGYDDAILTQVVRFYIYTYSDDWPTVRQDKIDYLLTRLGTRSAHPGTDLRGTLDGLWAILHRAPPPADRVQQTISQVEAIRREAGEVQSLDELNGGRVIPRFRELKHDLGAVFFYPPVLWPVVVTNVTLQEAVQRLYDREERRIVVDYQRIFDLEQQVSVDADLDHELDLFRHDVERFEEELQSKGLRLADLEQLRTRVRLLLPRLRDARSAPPRGAGDDPGPAPAHTAAPPTISPLPPPRAAASTLQPGATEPPGAPEPDAPQPDALAVPGHLLTGELGTDGHLAATFRRVIDGLGEIKIGADPSQAVLGPEVYALHLEPREVVAYRRLGDDGSGDREVEEFVLAAAALRLRLGDDQSAVALFADAHGEQTAGDDPDLASARHSLRLADAALAHLGHLSLQAMRVGEIAEAQHLDVLRNRLMYDYARLWLLIYRPQLVESGSGLS